MDILDIKKIVKDLPEQEVKLYLQIILLKIGLLEDKENSLVEFTNDLKEIYNKILNPKDKNQNTFDKGNYQKVHIQFGYPYLRQTLKELNLLEEDFIITFDDNIAIAPIGNLDTEKGQTDRFNWLKNNLPDEYEIEDYRESFPRVISQLLSIPVNVPIYIWVSENANEQTGLLFTMYLLRERKNNIFIIDTATFYRELFEKRLKNMYHFFLGD